MSRTNELLFKVMERYQYHILKVNHENPIVAETARAMVDIDICELWMLTQ